MQTPQTGLRMTVETSDYEHFAQRLRERVLSIWSAFTEPADATVATASTSGERDAASAREPNLATPLPRFSN